MNTKDFKSRTILNNRANPYRKEDEWVMGIDMGYSTRKVMCRNFYGCFPSYARKLSKNAVSMAAPRTTDILYRDDEHSDVYAVGEKANEMNSVENTNDNNATLYGRNHYLSEIFRVTSRVALALCLMTNNFGSPTGKKLSLQTGLPPAYMVDDTKLLIEAFAGYYSFDVKIGIGPWCHFEFELDEKNIKVMQQPMGTLVSLSTDKNGLPTPDAQKLFRSKLLVFDPGFRTGDTSFIKGGSIELTDCHTIDNLSMIEVLSNTSNVLREKFGANVPVPAMQNYLENGIVRVMDKKHFSSRNIQFADILAEENKKVCMNAINKLAEIYNYFEEVDYLALTGGTGAAWSNYFRERLKDMETLTILSGNRNDDIPYIFNNVRGYYMYLINRV